MNNEQEESHDVQVVNAKEALSIVEQITGAELDRAIVTAKRYPRDLAQVREDTLYYAAADQETAEDCFFALPRKKKNEKTGLMEDVEIEGEGIRLAEIMVNSWGNIKFGKRIIGIDKVAKKITAQAVVFDLQRNVFASVDETRNICNNKGQLFSEELITTTGRAAMSIALRNAIFQVIPKVFFKNIIKEIKLVASGAKKGTMVKDEDWKPQPLDVRAKKAVQFFVNWGISQERVLHAISVKSIEDITEEKLQTLTGIRSGVNQGEVNLVDAFPMTQSDQSKAVGQEILAKAGRTATAATEVPIEVTVDPNTVPAADPVSTEQATATARPSLLNKHKNKGA